MPRKAGQFRYADFLVLFLISLALVGCSRSRYRQKADAQTYEIIAEHMNNPQWTLPSIDIQPQLRSRNFDPADPDFPRPPPDDPAARQIMLNPSGIGGAALWKKLPELGFWENPDWSSYFIDPMDRDSEGNPSIEKLSLAQSVELALIHSREYQTQLENLYLSALALTFERYRFQVRPVGFLGEPGSGLFFQRDTELSDGGTLGTIHVGLSRLFPGGAQLVTELANDTLWLFSGTPGTFSATSLAFSFVKPLALGAGREIVLESLTQTERNVLYTIRNFARFRKQFFVSTITGGQVAGLQRFLRGFEFLAGGSSAPSVGFFPVLLRLQQLRNRQNIVRTLEYIIDDLEASGASSLDIASLESTLANTRGDLYADQRVFEDRVDQFKVQLGLPPDMDVTLDDSLLEPFEFVDPVLIQLEDDLRSLGRDHRSTPKGQDTQEMNDKYSVLLNQASSAIELVADDIKRLGRQLPEQLETLDAANQEQLNTIIAEETSRFSEVCEDISQLQLNDKQLDDKQFAQAIRALLVLVRKLSVVQIIVRVELIPIRPFDMDFDEAVLLATEHRLDLMNRRGQVMDARRNLEVAADRLEAIVDIKVDGALRTQPLLDGKKPFDFRGSESEYRAGVAFNTPLDRLEQRNDFRAAQIAYAQARRGYVGAEDNIKLEVRQEVRTLHALSKSIVQRRRRVQYSARELDLAESQEEKAQRGLNLNNALRNLNRAQDELIEVWLDYETTRLNLFRDLGTMEINEQGFWNDPFYQNMALQGTPRVHKAEELPAPSLPTE